MLINFILYDVKRDWLFRNQYEIWHPDSWIYDPEAFLGGVDEGDFGKASALERWLYYFDKGFMHTGYQPENVHSEFKNELIITKNKS